jgi:NHL repeat-containing protein
VPALQGLELRLSSAALSHCKKGSTIMRVSPLPKCAVAATAIALLTGCAAGSATGMFAHTSTTPQSVRPQLIAPQAIVDFARLLPPRQAPSHPAVCPPPPVVWASDLHSPPEVVGYDAAGNQCIVLLGGGGAFAAPFGLATDSAGRLYVADVNNARVVVFANNGAFLSVLNDPPGQQPIGVCVSTKGIVGVANRPSASTGTGIVEFYKNYLAPNPFNQASGVLTVFDFCAFDKRGDFFTDGTINYSGGGTLIAYLRYNNVFVPNPPLQVCPIADCNATHFWVGMYSHIRVPPQNILSVADEVTPNIENFNVTLAANPLLNFAEGAPGVPAVTALAGYPAGANRLYQVAPTTGLGVASRIYMGNYGAGQIEQVCCIWGGGAVGLYNNLTNAVGVATNPTGQY